MRNKAKHSWNCFFRMFFVSRTNLTGLIIKQQLTKGIKEKSPQHSLCNLLVPDRFADIVSCFCVPELWEVQGRLGNFREHWSCISWWTEQA